MRQRMKISQESKKAQLFWILNILIPVGLNIAMYLLLDSERLGVIIEAVAPEMSALSRALLEQKLVNIIVYIRDALWSFGLVFALSVWLRESLRRLRLAFIITLGFEVFVEIIRFSTGIAGSINIIHIACVFGGNLLAVFLILHHEHALSKKARATTLRLAEVLLILFLFMAGALLNTQKGLSRVDELVAQETYNAQYVVKNK